MATASNRTETQTGTHFTGVPAKAEGRWHPYIQLALALTIFFIAGGAEAPHVNETHYLTKAKHYWNPSYCPGDMFLDSADAHLAYYWTVGWLTLWMPLSTVAWVSRVAAWLLIAAGWLRLSRQVTTMRWAAVISALAWVVLMDKCDFAGEWVIGGQHGKGGAESKCFAYGLVLFGLADLLAGHWKRCWLWFGGASALHVLVGGWAALAAFGVWLSERRDCRAPLVTMMPAMVCGALLSLPGLVPALALDWHVSPEQSAEAAYTYVYERLPHHLVPVEQAPANFRKRVLRFGALVVAFTMLMAWTSRQHGDIEGPAAYRRDALARLMRFATFALMGNCIGLGIAILGADAPREAASLLRYYWFRQADIMVPAAVAIAAAAFLLHASEQGARPSARRARLALALGMVFGSAHLVRIAAGRAAEDSPPALSRMEDPAAWIAACEWIRLHAPPEAVCLIPRHGQSFKWYAERADVVNWKDIPQDALGVLEWRRRIQDVFPTVTGPDGPLVLGSPEQWGAARVRDVARRYGASYVVARNEPPLGLHEVCSVASPETGEGYSVYQIDDLAPPHATGGATQ